MPLYVWKCVNEDCPVDTFELSLKLAELDKTKVLCPKCSKESEKTIENPGHYRHVSWSSWKVGHGDS